MENLSMQVWFALVYIALVIPWVTRVSWIDSVPGCINTIPLFSLSALMSMFVHPMTQSPGEAETGIQLYEC